VTDFTRLQSDAEAKLESGIENGCQLKQQPRLRRSHIFARDENEHYVEPSWVSRRLFETEQFQGAIVDPACGWGTIVKEALRAGHCAAGFDLVDRGWDSTRTPLDFFTVNEHFDNIVTNPPFACVPEFITHAVECARYKVAAIFPFARLCAAHWLNELPLSKVLMLRPSMPPGRYIKAGGKVGRGRADFCWLIFEHGWKGAPELRWLHRDDLPWRQPGARRSLTEYAAYRCSAGRGSDRNRDATYQDKVVDWTCSRTFNHTPTVTSGTKPSAGMVACNAELAQINFDMGR
jgi:hypothetical protein